jgi:hypothetical protein
MKTHQDASAERDASPYIADTGASGGDGDVVFVGVGEDCGDFLSGSWSDGNLGKGGCKPLVGAEFGKTRRISADPRLGGDQLPKIPLKGRIRATK